MTNNIINLLYYIRFMNFVLDRELDIIDNRKTKKKEGEGNLIMSLNCLLKGFCNLMTSLSWDLGPKVKSMIFTSRDTEDGFQQWVPRLITVDDTTEPTAQVIKIGPFKPIRPPTSTWFHQRSGSRPTLRLLPLESLSFLFLRSWRRKWRLHPSLQKKRGKVTPDPKYDEEGGARKDLDFQH